jgi:uncharacterized cupin superfamily protein
MVITTTVPSSPTAIATTTTGTTTIIVEPNANGTTSPTSPPVRSTPIHVMDISPRTSSIMPTIELQSMLKGRSKRAIGPLFGLTNFGMNHSTLEPGASSSIQHYHTKQDEMIYILSGTATLRLDEQEIILKPGDVMGFPAGRPVVHTIFNHSTTENVVYLEIGDRTSGDTAIYHSSIDLLGKENDGKWDFYHKDGSPY